LTGARPAVAGAARRTFVSAVLVALIAAGEAAAAPSSHPPPFTVADERVGTPTGSLAFNAPLS
jgi:hypothetical protein